ncbi:hypothetical protein HPP92_024765 [Vanilla planifolia]|uniref:Uncharacterized protein n=1 Tax=Vanilla planifolia TaxID=51239 RepID=A0A835PMK4_VANPL|nr:hypothetical protein HPP92_024765 [Vanilla planifolia]
MPPFAVPAPPVISLTRSKTRDPEVKNANETIKKRHSQTLVEEEAITSTVLCFLFSVVFTTSCGLNLYRNPWTKDTKCKVEANMKKQQTTLKKSLSCIEVALA